MARKVHVFVGRTLKPTHGHATERYPIHTLRITFKQKYDGHQTLSAQRYMVMYIFYIPYNNKYFLIQISNVITAASNVNSKYDWFNLF